MVAVGVLSIVVYASSQFWGSVQSARKRAQIIAVQKYLALDAESKLRAPSSLYLSLFAPENDIYATCLLAADFKTVCEEGRTYSFALAYQTALNQQQTMSYMPTAPVSRYFNMRGLPCVQEYDADCAYRILTYYFVTGVANKQYETQKIGAYSNSEVEMVHVASQVEVREGKLKDLGIKLPPYPEKLSFISHSMDDILGPSRYSDCNLGAVIAGYGNNGRAICKCQVPYRERDVAYNLKGPLCAEMPDKSVTCPNSQVFQGLQENGSAKCVAPSGAYDQSQCLSRQRSCPPGFAVTKTYRSNCRYWCAAPKQSQSDCKFNEGAEDRDLKSGSSQRIYRVISGFDSQKHKIGFDCDVDYVDCCPMP